MQIILNAREKKNTKQIPKGTLMNQNKNNKRATMHEDEVFYFFYSEFWTTYSTQEWKLQVFNLGYFRRILGNTWYDKVRNNDVLSRAGPCSCSSFSSTPYTLAGLCSLDGRWTHPQRIYSTASLPLLGQGSVAAGAKLQTILSLWPRKLPKLALLTALPVLATHQLHQTKQKQENFPAVG